MDRSTLVRRAAPVAVFAAVLGTVVLVSRRSPGGGDPRPVPVAAGGAATGAKSGEARDLSAPAMAPFGGKVTIPGRLLAGLPTEGPVYALRHDGTERTAALAKALGVAGEVRTEPDGWTVGTDPRALHVANVAGLPWYLSTDAKERYATGGSGTIAVDAASGPSASASPDSRDVDGKDEPAPPPAPATEPAEPTADPPEPKHCPSPEDGVTVIDCGPVVFPVPPSPPSPAPQPTDAEARAAAEPVLAAAGVGDGTTTSTPGFLGKDVVVAPVVGGLPTSGYETRLTVDAEGEIVMANGYLARPDLDDTYPLLDPQAALERGGKPYYDGREPMPLGAPCVVGTPCPTYEPPERVATAIRLGLLYAPSFTPDETAYLVPAWLLSFEGSDYEEPLMALPDAYLATPPPVTADPDQPVCNPEPCGKPVPDGTVTDGGPLVPGSAPADGGGSDGSTGNAVAPDAATE